MSTRDVAFPGANLTLDAPGSASPPESMDAASTVAPHEMGRTAVWLFLSP